MSTEVIARDTETGEAEQHVIHDDYVVITDGRVYVDGMQVYANGTTVITLKRERLTSSGGTSTERL